MSLTFQRVFTYTYAGAMLGLLYMAIQKGQFGALQIITLMGLGLTAFALLKGLNYYESELQKGTTALEKCLEDQRSLRIVTDNAYHERNNLVAALTQIFPSGIRATDIEGWDPDWQNCVYIDTPRGQISYHYHTSEAKLFAHLPAYTKDWDGHSKELVHQRLNHPRLGAAVIPVNWIRHYFQYRAVLAMGCLELRAEEVSQIIDQGTQMDQELDAYRDRREANDPALHRDIDRLQMLLHDYRLKRRLYNEANAVAAA